MSSRVVMAVLLLAVALAVGAEPVEMTVKVFVAPERIKELAQYVLEFYEVTPEYFTAGVYEPGFHELVGQGYQVDVLVPDVAARARDLDAFFHTYEQIRDTWATIAQNHPSICKLDTIGTSAGGKLLLAMKVSSNPQTMEQKPRICFDFTIHGNENNGTEIAHYSLQQLVTGYGSNPDITRWVNTREIWLIPFVNPDGLISRSRTNSHGVDLNRNYGYSWNGGGSAVFSEPETKALYFLGRDNPMASWTQYHSGTKSAMWPWGYTQLATMDSVVHKYEMQRYTQITGYPSFQISRGLYPVNGGSTDWYYGATGALGFGVEVCNGQPSPIGEIDTINHANWSAMKEMIERVAWGVRGIVRDSLTGLPLDARVSVTPPDWFTLTDTLGFFAKNMHAGTYTVKIEANGYATRTLSGVVVPADSFVSLTVDLAPDTTAPACAMMAITNKLGNTNAANHWWALGRRNGRRFALDRGAWASFDMGRRTPIMNGPGSDFTVVGDESSPAVCSVFVSNEWNGPWTRVGFGAGTQSYDLDAAGLPAARFVRIVDDNVGTPGFAIDAIEAVVVNAPMVVYQGQTVIDSPPGGNADGRLDPGEQADLIVALKNSGRVGVNGVSGRLRTSDSYVSVLDSLGAFGDIGPDSVKSNGLDRFRLSASSGAPREHRCQLTLHLAGTDYADSVRFEVVVGEMRRIDPIPDGPRLPALYWAYDEGDSFCDQRPTYEWAEINSVGTRLSFANNDAVIAVNLPSGFGPLKYYGERYTQVSVSADGWIAPGNYTTSNYNNTGLPSTSAPPGALCPNWDDLYPGYSSAGYVYWYHDSGNRRFIVEFDSVAYYNQNTVRDKFQVVFYDTTLASPSGNSVFDFQYMTANGFSSSTVGIQDPTRAIGIQAFLDGSYHNGCLPLGARRAIRFADDPPTGAAERPLPEWARTGLRAEINPFTDKVALRYTLPASGRVEVSVYDPAGRRVRTLLSHVSGPGEHAAVWDGADGAGRKLAAGLYWVRLDSDAGAAAVKVVKAR